MSFFRSGLQSKANIQSPDLGRWMGWASSGGPPREARPLDNEVVGKY